MAMLDAKVGTQAAGRDFLCCLRLLIRYAIDIGLRESDPTLGIKTAKQKSDGFRTWSEEDITAFESHYPVGTKPRLAFELLLHTAQRRADVIRLGPQHVRGGVISIRQQKTGKSLAIPLSPAPAPAPAATPSKHLTLAATAYGQQFNA